MGWFEFLNKGIREPYYQEFWGKGERPKGKTSKIKMKGFPPPPQQNGVFLDKTTYTSYKPHPLTTGIYTTEMKKNYSCQRKKQV